MQHFIKQQALWEDDFAQLWDNTSVQSPFKVGEAKLWSVAG